jgi:excisionase family DNA binding protein
MCDTVLEKVQSTQSYLHQSEVLSVAEVAAALRFTPTTIYAKLERGEIRGVRTSPTARIRIPRSELERLLRPEAKLSPVSFPGGSPGARGRAESTSAAQRGTNGTQPGRQ